MGCSASGDGPSFPLPPLPGFQARRPVPWGEYNGKFIELPDGAGVGGVFLTPAQHRAPSLPQTSSAGQPLMAAAFAWARGTPHEAPSSGAQSSERQAVALIDLHPVPAELERLEWKAHQPRP